MAWTDPRTWAAAETVTAALMNTHVRDNLKELGDAWAAFTPTWTAITTNPTIGNGTIVGAYRNPGKLVHFRIRITFGSTTTVGSGAYLFSMPFAPLVQPNVPAGLLTAFDSSASSVRTRFLYIRDATTMAAHDDGGTNVTHALPFAWGTSDTITLSGTYERS